MQLISGSARSILDEVQSQDVVTFTGSAITGRMLKSHPRIISEAVPFNMEADSLNSCVLGEDVMPGTPEFDIFIKEVRKEMTVKCGQKCTAIRRIIVPEKLMEDETKDEILKCATQLQDYIDLFVIKPIFMYEGSIIEVKSRKTFDDDFNEVIDHIKELKQNNKKIFLYMLYKVKEESGLFHYVIRYGDIEMEARK